MLLLAILACSRPTALPDQAPWSAWSAHLHLAPEQRPTWPDQQPVALQATATERLGTPVLLDPVLSAVGTDCPSWPLPPLVRHDDRYTSARALPPIDQRLELLLDPAQGLVRLERIIDTPQSAPSPGHWPAGWTLEASADGHPVELPRDDDTVWWPAGQRLVLSGDGPLPPPAHLDEQGLTFLAADVVDDRTATTTGLAVLGSAFHIEPNRGQSVAGNELVVAGVRFPHHRSREGVRVLANAEADLDLLDRLLATGVELPRPLWVLPGPRDAYVGQHLVLGPDAWRDDLALRQALWHLQPLDPALRRARQALEAPPSPVVDPGCFGLRSRPDLDWSPLLAQVLLRDPDTTATSWAELEARHPWLTPWLDAPRWPRLALRTEGDQATVVDTAATGLPLLVPLTVGDERLVVAIGDPVPLGGRPVAFAAETPLPAHPSSPER